MPIRLCRTLAGLSRPAAAILLLSALLPVHLSADERTMSFNDVIPVVPAPGPVVVDGQDGDWDLSAGVWSYNDPTLVDRYSVWTHLMYDAKGVYFMARVSDPTPMRNAAAGKDFSVSWRSDCYQARVIFDDRTADEHQMHLNMYWSSTDKQPYLIVKHGGFKDKEPYDATGRNRPDQLERWSPTMAAAGGSIAIAPWADGKGYNMECFWPWSYLRTSGKPLAAGEQFTFGIETMWGNSDGTMMTHRLADGIKDETVNRIFMFRARDGWGRAVLAPAGHLTVSDEQRALQKERLKRFQDFDTYGSIPIAYDLKEHSDVTIAIDDAQGRRVRNLIGQYPRDAGAVKDLWDGLDDAGNPVSPGTYTATILHHQPVQLKLFNSVYSSSTPPWTTEKGSLFWGSNHGHPTSVASRGPVTVLYFTGTEGGSGIQRVDDQGKILWRDGQEFVAGAIDERFAYGLSVSSWQSKTLLFRYDVTSGQMTPFADAERSPSAQLLADAKVPHTSTLASAHGSLWALLPGRGFLRIDPATGHTTKELPDSGLLAVTDRDGHLYALTTASTIVEIDAEGTAGAPLTTIAGLVKPVRLAADQDGKRFLISDHGTNQVLLCDRSGAVLRRFGRAYDSELRPAGAFVTTDLIRPMGTGFDHLGRIWIPEGVKSCKRVGLWKDDGTLLDQFWGQADYGAMAAFPLTYDSTRFIAHGIEFRLDPKPDPLQRKTEEQPLVFHPELAEQRGLVYRVDGRDYACGAPGYNKSDGLVIFRRDEHQVFVPCVRLTPGRSVKVDGKMQAVPGHAWIDRNGDGQESADELSDVDYRTMYWSNGWVRPDLAILTTNGLLFKTTGFTAAGVPLYDFASTTAKVADWPAYTDRQSAGGTPVIDAAGDVSNGITWRTADGHTGSYPNPYGRHDAPASRRGLLIAPFRTNGVVEGVPGAGAITALGGDRGEWFMISMDGLYISSICQDIKSNVVLDETLTGGESFGGFLWRDAATGKVLVQLGGASYRLMEVTGLDSCVKERRTLTVDQQQIRAGLAVVQQRQQQQGAEPARLRIAAIRGGPQEPAPVMQPLSKPLIDGAVDVRVTEEGNPAVWWRAALAIDGKDLVAMWQVADPNPWLNSQGQFTHAFIGGDAVDLQLDIPGRGPVRIMGAKIAGKDTVTYWQAQAATPENPTTYAVANNLTNATVFPVVKRLDDAVIKSAVGFNSYTVLLRVPLAAIGLDQQRGKEISGVVGVVFSDPSGTNRASRVYWHDKQTGLVSDVPSEARLFPKRWGPIDIDR